MDVSPTSMLNISASQPKPKSREEKVEVMKGEVNDNDRSNEQHRLR